MRIEHLKNMTRGWIVGNFEPSLYKTEDVEVAVKSYDPGDFEEWHFHKVATEITVVVNGRIMMNNREYGPGDIIVMEPGEGTDFKAIEKTVLTVVKVPGATNDKYLKSADII